MAKSTRSSKRGMPSKGPSPRKRGAPRRAKPAAPAAPDIAPPASSGTAGGGIAGAAGAAVGTVRIRFYCQGIGDCHLLRFEKPGGAFWMLIDCGVHSSVPNGTQTIRDIVDNIRTLTDRLDVIVLTHEHWDHNSGFFSALDQFKEFKVGEIWLGWTENAADPQARELDKFKGEALKALQGASQRLDGAQGLTSYLASVQQGLQAVLGFNFGAKGEKVRSARDAVIALAPDRVKFLEPKDAPFELPVAPGMRVYVLGPPRDKAMLGVTDRASEMYGIDGFSMAPVVRALNNSFGVSEGSGKFWDDATAPFDSNEGFVLSELLKTPAEEAPRSSTDADKGVSRKRTADLIHGHYGGKDVDQDWRRIDNDWLGVSADLAIQIDKRTNNSSLVLAFEFLETNRVMLFVGDAQVGNWLSWKDVQWKIGDKTVSGHDLLARTVFYKVGHHGSHNATLKQNGLELMTSADLSAFIPTNEVDAKRVGWGEMPFEPLLEDLKKRTLNRVIRADDPWLKQGAAQPDFANAPGAIKALRSDPKGLWVELDIG
jgi:hypothetical protein